MPPRRSKQKKQTENGGKKGRKKKMKFLESGKSTQGDA